MKLTHRTVNQSVIRSGGLPAGHDFLSAIHRYGNVLNQVCRRKRVHTRNTHKEYTRRCLAYGGTRAKCRSAILSCNHSVFANIDQIPSADLAHCQRAQSVIGLGFCLQWPADGGGRTQCTPWFRDRTGGFVDLFSDQIFARNK